ncbi:MAG TPA: T9SS type A sorting domain-containing protein [Flavobacteriales bacterium]|nr:T9SS type A sorting domain-containing protein [Flavobacteriales bacterium]
MRKQLLFQCVLILLVITSTVIQAQNQLIVSLTTGQSDAFYVSNVRSIKFLNNNMIVTENNGVQSSWGIDDITDYTFKSANAIGSAESIKNQLSIFPNPVSDQLSMEYWSIKEDKITIELVDINGKHVRSLFEGMHQGKHTYTWTNDLPSGMYVCRVVSKYKSISKPFVIQ